MWQSNAKTIACNVCGKTASGVGRWRQSVALFAAIGFLATFMEPATAHFLEVLPSKTVLSEGGSVSLDLIFTHPMGGGPTMNLAKPDEFGVQFHGKVIDLTDTLKERTVDGKTAWTADYKLEQPGVATFFVKPQPYFDPAEQQYIKHFAKVMVDSYASGEGWDELVGLPVEIKPLVRPTGVWTGNVFRGVVLRDGQPVPNTEIEVEYLNDDSVKVPNDSFYTQVIKTDQNGVFSYAMPHSGWWGFAALLESKDKRKSPEGKLVPTELGALIWIKTTPMQGTPDR